MLYGGVAVLKLCRGLCNGTGGVDIRIEEPGVEAHGATMDNGCGGGKAMDGRQGTKAVGGTRLGGTYMVYGGCGKWTTNPDE
eukprot:scaffold39886_cov309-Isochrysis_galbana.AAC.1